jgi:hypothetical protein
MDLRAILSGRPSKQIILGLAESIGADSGQFAGVVNLVLANEKLVSQYAAWLLDHCLAKHPQLARPHLHSLIGILRMPKPQKGIVRATMKALSNADIPEELKGLALQHCYERLLDPAEEAAVRVFSMQAVFNISKNEPDLLRELQMVIEEGMEYGTAGYQSRGRRILGEIGRLLKYPPK